MTLGPALPAPLDVAARAVLNHPDRRSGWTIVVAGTVSAPPDVDRLHAAVPLASARLAPGTWVAGTPAPPVTLPGDPLRHSDVWRAIDLAREAPVRVLIGDDNRVAVAAHHAAFDGLSVLTLLHLLAGQSPTPRLEEVAYRIGTPLPRDSGGAGRWRRLLQPADRVAPSAPEPTEEVGVWRAIRLDGGGVTARLTAAVAAAVAQHNATRGRPWREVGVSLGLGGPAGVGNLATYRRIDVGADDDVAAAVTAAIASEASPPAELRRAPRALRLLAPIVARLGDSFLVSNLGRHDLTGLSDVAFFPVARGPSAVSVGAVGRDDGLASVSLRARHLDGADATALLDGVISSLS